MTPGLSLHNDVGLVMTTHRVGAGEDHQMCLKASEEMLFLLSVDLLGGERKRKQ